MYVQCLKDAGALEGRESRSSVTKRERQVQGWLRDNSSPISLGNNMRMQQRYLVYLGKYVLTKRQSDKPRHSKDTGIGGLTHMIYLMPTDRQGC